MSDINSQQSEPIIPPQPILLSSSVGQRLAQPWATDQHVFPIKYSAGRATERSVVFDYRTGEIAIDDHAMSIQGKAVLAGSIRGPLIVVALLLGAGWLFAYILLEYVIRVNRADSVMWDDVERVVLDPRRQRACIGYHLMGKPKASFGLGLKLDGGLYEEFASAMRSRIPDRVAEGKILSATPLWQWIFVGVVVAAIIIGLIVLSVHN